VSARLGERRAARGLVIGMDRDRALDLLSPAYAVALRLADAGADEAMIAAGTGVDPASVPALLELARAKLDELLTSGA